MNIAQPGEDQGATSLGARADSSGDVLIHRPTFDGTNSAPVVEDALQSNSRISDLGDGSLEKLPAPAPAPVGGKLSSSSKASTVKDASKGGGSVAISKTKSLEFSSDVDKLASKISKAVEQVKKKDAAKASEESDVQKKGTKEDVEDAVKDGEGGDDDAAAKKRKRKSWKKPKDKPKRPLSAYNLFFQAERAVMLGDAVNITAQGSSKRPNQLPKKRVHRKSHGKIGFAEMARVIGGKWKTLPDEAKSKYEAQAEREKKRYEVELEAWKEAQRIKTLELEVESHQRELAQKQLQQQKLKLQAQQEQQQQMLQQMGMAGPGDGGPGGYPGDSAAAFSLMMADREQRLLQQQQQQLEAAQQMPSFDYLRALQAERRQQMALFGAAGSGPNMLPGADMPAYPNAAAASANAIMQMTQQQRFQGQMGSPTGGLSSSGGGNSAMPGTSGSSNSSAQFGGGMGNISGLGGGTSGPSNMGGPGGNMASGNAGVQPQSSSSSDQQLQYLMLARQRQQLQQQQQQLQQLQQQVAANEASLMAGGNADFGMNMNSMRMNNYFGGAGGAGAGGGGSGNSGNFMGGM